MSSREDNTYSSESDSTTNTCATCTTYALEGRFDFSDPRDAVHAVVHETCSECDAFKVDESQLCDFCIHIRPSHFVTCSRVFDAYRYKLLGFSHQYKVVIGTLPELRSRQGGCAFCQWCLEVVQADARLQHHNINEEEAVCIQRSNYCDSGLDFPGCIVYMTKGIYPFSGISDVHVQIVHNNGFKKTSAVAENGTSTVPNQDFSVVPSVVDWATVTGWKAQCEREHRTCGETAVGKLPHHFRLIDVANKRIIDADNNTAPFFALSYVWGAGSEKETALRQKNLSELQKSGSLNDLPQTIADAMCVCEQLGQTYLWVDRLCIVQDDREDKYGQIRSLEAIYTRAELVIVAACGDNMQSGLAGVDSEFPRERCQTSIEFPGCTMANKVQEPIFTLNNTKWNERGWTYQEAVLARRKLYFTSTELWFECAQGLQRESTSSDANGDKPSRVHHLTTYGSCGVESRGDVFEEYGYHLSRYSRRILTYPSDIYHAFHGIEHALYPESEIIFGLPASDFSRALLWYTHSGSNLQERQCSDRDIVLPSWSWASLMAEVQVLPSFSNSIDNTHLFDGSFYCSICSWATLAQDDQETLHLVNSNHDEKIWKILDNMWTENKLYRYHPTHRQVLALAWARGCIEADKPTDLLQLSSSLDWTGDSPEQLQASSIRFAQELESRWPTIQDFWIDVQNGKHQIKDSPTPHGLDRGHLVTRTQSSVMYVELLKRPLRKVFSIRQADTHRRDGEVVGSLLGMGEYKLRGTGTLEAVAGVEFIALAVGSLPYDIACDLEEEVVEKNRFYKQKLGIGPNTIQPGVIVMAIRWTGSIAHRIAIGWVTLQGWVDSKPEFRTIVLA